MNQIIPTKNSKQNNLSVIGQKGESQNGRYKKTKLAKFSKKQAFFIP